MVNNRYWTNSLYCASLMWSRTEKSCYDELGSHPEHKHRKCKLFKYSQSALNEQIEFHENPLSSLKAVHWTRSHTILHIPGLKSDELVSVRQTSRVGQTSTLSNTAPKHRELISYRETHPPEYSPRPITAHETGAECQTTLSAGCPPRHFFLYPSFFMVIDHLHVLTYWQK